MRKILLLPILLVAFCTKAQTTITDSIFTGGEYRYYTLYVPAAYDGSEARPLVLNLHGYGSAAFQQIFYGEFRLIADTANFLILLPDGTKDFFGFQFWNTFDAFGTGVDDVAFIDELLDTISASYNIDANRVYSTGMSNGGFMSYELACQLGDRIAAIASVTGSIDVDHFDFCNPTHLTPVMEIHGTADPTVPYDGTGEFMPIQEVLDYWIDFNNCSTIPSVSEVPDIDAGDGSTAEYIVYDGGDNAVTVEHYKIINGGHTWPGTILLLPGAGSTNKDIYASLEIWKFFSRYSLDVLTGLSDLEAKTNPNIYPNPGNGLLFLDGYETTIGKNYSVYNLNGALQTSGMIQGNTLDLTALPAGLYLLQLPSGTALYQKD